MGWPAPACKPHSRPHMPRPNAPRSPQAATNRHAPAHGPLAYKLMRKCSFYAAQTAVKIALFPHSLPRRHETRNPRRPRGLQPRPDDQVRCRARLPDRGLRLRQRAAWRRPVRPQGAGQHLHAHDEPDQRRARKAHCGARRRHRRAGRGLGHGGHHLRDPDAGRSGRQHRLGQHHLRRHLQPVCAHLPAARHHHALCRPARSGRLCAPHRRAHQGDLRRVDRQPAGQRDRHRRAG